MLPRLIYGQADSLQINSVFLDSTVLRFVSKEKKPIILDFFASTCSFCFKKMPELKKLQASNSDKVRFLLIGVEDGRVQSIYHQFEKKFALSFPVMFDSVLPQKIGLRACPTYVWIGVDGKIKAVTGFDEVTISNIDRFSNGESIEMIQQNPVYRYNPELPFLVNSNAGPDTSVLFRYTFSRWQIGQPVCLPVTINTYGDSSRFTVMCASISRLYNYASSGFGTWETNSQLYGNVWPDVVNEAADTARFNRIAEGKYCLMIESKFRFMNVRRLQQTLCSLLETSFGYQATIEERYMPCWILEVSKKGKDKLISKNTEASMYQDHLHLRLRNQPVSTLISILAKNNHLIAPVIDKTGIDGNIDLELNCALFSFSELQKALSANGLNLLRATKKMKVIVLRDSGKNVATR